VRLLQQTYKTLRRELQTQSLAAKKNCVGIITLAKRKVNNTSPAAIASQVALLVHVAEM
jgi:hypothetical protein